MLSAEDLDRIGKFERYRDVDGDGIPYRTLPGTEHPLAAYFTRGSGHNEKAGYSEKPEDYKNNMDRLRRKYETARKHVPAPVFEGDPNAEIGIIAFGSSHWAMLESRDQLQAEQKIPTEYLRLRALPFNDDLRDFVKRKKRIYVVEQNRDGQMLRPDPPGGLPDDCNKVRSVRHYTGFPLDARTVTDEILTQELSS